MLYGLLCPYGIFCGQLVCFFPFWYDVPREIWQPFVLGGWALVSNVKVCVCSLENSFSAKKQNPLSYHNWLTALHSVICCTFLRFRHSRRNSLVEKYFRVQSHDRCIHNHNHNNCYIAFKSRNLSSHWLLLVMQDFTELAFDRRIGYWLFIVAQFFTALLLHT
jgi:hypothetical protein